MRETYYNDKIKAFNGLTVPLFWTDLVSILYASYYIYVMHVLAIFIILLRNRAEETVALSIYTVYETVVLLDLFNDTAGAKGQVSFLMVKRCEEG